MPQMSPISWMFIVLTLMSFILVVSSNTPKMNKIMNMKKNMILTKKTMKW